MAKRKRKNANSKKSSAKHKKTQKEPEEVTQDVDRLDDVGRHEGLLEILTLKPAKRNKNALMHMCVGLEDEQSRFYQSMTSKMLQYVKEQNHDIVGLVTRFPSAATLMDTIDSVQRGVVPETDPISMIKMTTSQEGSVSEQVFVPKDSLKPFPDATDIEGWAKGLGDRELFRPAIIGEWKEVLNEVEEEPKKSRVARVRACRKK